MHRRLISIELICLILLGWVLTPYSHGEDEKSPVSDVLVVFNKKQRGSEDVAEYYAEKRNILKDHILGINCPTEDEISRTDYNKTILHPIREYLQSRGLIKFENIPIPQRKVKGLAAIQNKIRYIVLCYGIPLKIAHDPNEPLDEGFQDVHTMFQSNNAAIDSELANLPFPAVSTTYILKNPLYNKTFSQALAWNLRLICVTRLDGPDADSAKRIVDDTLEAERLGLYGRALFDYWNTTTEAYKLGDEWISRTENYFNDQGWEFMSERTPQTFAEDADAQHCAIYAGWYTEHMDGPFRNPHFRFQKGAVAYHIHSWSARTLRTTETQWASPLIAKGAAATMGCVYEPYLQFSPNVDIIFKRLLEGCSWGEAAYSCQEFLSWMTTVIGDPLYRPFGVPNEDRIAGFEARFDSLDDEERAALAWAYRMKARQIFQTGKKADAVQLLQRQAKRLEKPILWEGLANLYLLAGESSKALEATEEALEHAKDPQFKTSLMRLAARTANQAKDWEKSLDYYHQLVKKMPRLPDYRKLCEEAEKVAINSEQAKEVEFFYNLRNESPSP